nr:7346_t:CDS:2 [Entrophospora candida]
MSKYFGTNHYSSKPPLLRSTDDFFLFLNEKLTNDVLVNDECIAIDCEMVGVGYQGRESALARVSIVNYYGTKLLDKYVKPKKVVMDYRTPYSGITKELLENAHDFDEVQREVQELMNGKLIIGQSLGYDFNVLKLDYLASSTMIRDTSHYYYLFGDKFGRKPNKSTSLKTLAKEVLGLQIQEGMHDSVEDAKTCMLLYRLKQNEWETPMNAARRSSLDIGKCYICKSPNHVKRQYLPPLPIEFQKGPLLVEILI